MCQKKNDVLLAWLATNSFNGGIYAFVYARLKFAVMVLHVLGYSSGI